MTLAGTWRPSPALARAVVLTGLFVIAGVVLGRVDLVLLATPFALGTAWALRRRPGLPPQLEITGGGFAVEGGDVTGVVSVGNPDTVTYDLAVLRIAVSFWLSLADSERPHVVTVPPRRAADLVLAGSARRWGRHPLGPAAPPCSPAAGCCVPCPNRRCPRRYRCTRSQNRSMPTRRCRGPPGWSVRTVPAARGGR